MCVCGGGHGPTHECTTKMGAGCSVGVSVGCSVHRGGCRAQGAVYRGGGRAQGAV